MVPTSLARSNEVSYVDDGVRLQPISSKFKAELQLLRLVQNAIGKEQTPGLCFLIGNQNRVENKLFMYAEERNIHVEKPKDFHSAQWFGCTRLQTQRNVYSFRVPPSLRPQKELIELC